MHRGAVLNNIQNINVCIDLLMHNMVYEMANTPSRLPVGVTQAENLSDGG